MIASFIGASLFLAVPGQAPIPDDGVFECSPGRSICFDLIGNRTVFVNQRNELVIVEKGELKPKVIALEKKEGANYLERMPASVACVGDGRHAVVAYRDGRLEIWDCLEKRRIRELDAGGRLLNRLGLSGDGKFLACSTSRPRRGGGPILIWRTADWAQVGEIDVPGYMGVYQFAADDREIRFTLEERAARLPDRVDGEGAEFRGIVAWDLAAGKESRRMALGTGSPGAFAVSRDGKWVACGVVWGKKSPVDQNSFSFSGVLRVYDWESGKIVAEPLRPEWGRIEAIAFSPDGRTLYSPFQALDKTRRGFTGVKAFSAPDWAESWSLTLGKGYAHSIDVSLAGDRVLAVFDSKLFSIDAKHGESHEVLMRFRLSKEELAEIKELTAPKP